MSDFYNNFTKVKPDWIGSIVNNNGSYTGIPPFINFYKIDNIDYAFFGEDKISGNEHTIANWRFASTSIFLPKGIRMIMANELNTFLANELANNDDFDKIDPTVLNNDYLYDGQITEPVKLEFCTNIRKNPNGVAPQDILEEIHLCDRYSDISIKAHSKLRGTCSSVVDLISGFQGSIAQYLPLLFYIEKASIKDDVETTLQISMVFREECDGYFLIPVFDPSGGISYICIPNADEYYMRYGTGVKQILNNFINQFSNLGLDSNRFPVLALDDILVLPIDHWNGFLYRDFRVFPPTTLNFELVGN